MTIAEIWKEEAIREVALEMLKKGLDISFVAEVTHMDVKEVHKLKEEIE